MIEITTSKPFDTVWSKVIELFATKGISIKVIDKSSGLIETEKYSFLNSYSYEDKNGELINPDACVVINRPGLNPTEFTGEWNVRVKSEGDKTLININIVNLDAETYIPGNQFEAARTYKFTVMKSTGVFEKIIADYILGQE